MEAQVGLEPTTCRLQGGRTTNCAIKPYDAMAQPIAAEVLPLEFPKPFSACSILLRVGWWDHFAPAPHTVYW